MKKWLGFVNPNKKLSQKIVLLQHIFGQKITKFLKIFRIKNFVNFSGKGLAFREPKARPWGEILTTTPCFD